MPNSASTNLQPLNYPKKRIAIFSFMFRTAKNQRLLAPSRFLLVLNHALIFLKPRFSFGPSGKAMGSFNFAQFLQPRLR